MEVIIKPWHGIPRENIKWHPTVDEAKCIGCGMCVTGCGRKVYGFDYEKQKPVIVRSLNCMVACVTCANTCLKDAITFPQVDGIKKLMKEEKLLARALAELAQRKEELKV